MHKVKRIYEKRDKIFGVCCLYIFDRRKENESNMDIKELRKSKKLTQAAFAEAIGVKAPTVTAIETGRRRMTEEVAAKINGVFGVDVEREIKAVKRKAKTTAKKAASEPKEAPEKRGIVIQSPMGGEITPDEILAKIAKETKGSRIGNVDTVYVRVDENKAFWVKGKKRGAIDLW